MESLARDKLKTLRGSGYDLNSRVSASSSPSSGLGFGSECCLNRNLLLRALSVS